MMKVDPITLSVVRGILETTQREMTLSLEKTSRSSVLNLARDYSTSLFNATPEMILQGQDIPIHLGSLMPAMKAVANFFSGEIHEGDLILHNDPAYNGSHILDMCIYKPVFFEGKHVFWTVCKGKILRGSLVNPSRRAKRAGGKLGFGPFANAKSLGDP